MKITVVCFGAMRSYLPDDAIGNRAQIEVSDGARVADAVDALGAPQRLVFALLIDGRRADLESALEDGAEVTIMPPFAGGASASGSPALSRATCEHAGRGDRRERFCAHLKESRSLAVSEAAAARAFAPPRPREPFRPASRRREPPPHV